MRHKASKYTYQLFKKVDEGSLDELARRNSMTAGNLENSYRKNKIIYGEYYVIKKLKEKKSK